jgi:V/A-type H+-transporting ATPase subunit E
MGSELLRLLEEEVRAEVDAVLTEARTRTDEILNAARADADATMVEAQRRVDHRRADARARATSAARLRAQALVLQTKDAAIREIFNGAEALVRDALRDPPRRRATLTAFLREARAALGPGSVVVEAAPDDLAAAAEVCRTLAWDADVRPAADVADGVRVLSRDRRTVVENTLASRLVRIRGGLAATVASALWASEV